MLHQEKLASSLVERMSSLPVSRLSPKDGWRRSATLESKKLCLVPDKDYVVESMNNVLKGVY